MMGGQHPLALAALFPSLTAGQVHAATAARWDLSGALPVPRPGWLACPVCGCETVQPRFWRWHVRSGGPTVVGRCDVSFKCCDCAAVWVHGVAVPDGHVVAPEMRRRLNRQIQWRDARKMLEADMPTIYSPTGKPRDVSDHQAASFKLSGWTTEPVEAEAVEPEHVCDVCGKAAKSAGGLGAHRRSHAGDDE